MSRAQTMGRNYKGSMILTDDEVREARIMSEHKGITRHEIAEHFNVDPSYIGKILDYQIRSRIYIDQLPPINSSRNKSENFIFKAILATILANGSVSFGSLSTAVESKIAISEEIKNLREAALINCEVVGGLDGFVYRLTDAGSVRASCDDILQTSPLRVSAPVEKKKRIRAGAKKEKTKIKFHADPLSAAFAGMATVRIE